MTPKTLEIAKVTKKFSGQTAVKDLSLQIAAGEIYGLIGPNGSGKTTTIKMVAGLYRPTAGSITVCGADVVEAPTRAKRRLGYVPDDPDGYDRLTGREFLEFVGQLYGLERRSRDRKIEELLARYDLVKLALGQFGRYSRGTKQKFSILAALLHVPSLLLVDEPMVGLDPASVVVTEELFREFVASGGAIQLSTHTLAIAEVLCDRLGLLKEGRLAAEGTLADLRSRAGAPSGTLEECYLTLAAKL